MADKDPDGYPTEVLMGAKVARKQAVSLIGGTPFFASRPQARRAVKKILRKNRIAFRENGPNPETGGIESSERAEIWSDCVLREIVPNNRLIVAIVEINEGLATDDEIDAAELLRNHTDALERKHLGHPLLGPSPRFPLQIELLFEDGEQ
ncbi:hypothetical protein ACFWP2_03610 [Kitasatospora sp. NPDC058444]|uniref:hypothetical protein n=1 Tax=Kitasatospora sp. NPDC058444 TaxID=3346504 RepID=UPI003656F8BF